jgi:Ca-activated chloride channel family protein
VDALRAEGGTNISGALEEALRMESPEDRLPIVLFLTDGLPTVGEQNPERIAAAAERRRGRARVFTFGVGYDVNTVLLDRLSAAGRGTTAFVEPGEDVERALGTLAARITHPVLTDLELDGAPVRFEEVYPGTLPDLFAGEELVVFGRYVEEGRGALRIGGRRAGRTEQFAITASFPARSGANDYIPRLWASRKLGELTRQVRLNGPDPELIEEIRATALRYGLLSEYTSYLVQEPVTVADGRIQPLPMDRARFLGAGAPAAIAVTGEAAVKSSESARARREVASAAALDEAEALLVAPARADTRTVGGRTFRLRDGVWTELARADAGGRVVAIRAFGPAYFELLRQAPELRAIVAELPAVLVTGAAVSFLVGDEGADDLSPERVAGLVAEFRGR